MVQIHFPKLFFFFFFYSTTVRTFYFSALCFSTYFMYILLFFFYLKRERQKSTDKGTESSPERVCVSVCVCLYIHIRSIWYCADWLRFPLPINIGDFALHRLLNFSSLSLWQTIQPTLHVSKREKDQHPFLFVCFFMFFSFLFLYSESCRLLSTFWVAGALSAAHLRSWCSSWTWHIQDRQRGNFFSSRIRPSENERESRMCTHISNWDAT